MTLACEDANSKLVKVVTVTHVDDEKRADNSLVQIWKVKLSFMTKPQLPNLQQTVANTILITNISNSNNLNKFWVGIFTRQGHINQVY